MTIGSEPPHTMGWIELAYLLGQPSAKEPNRDEDLHRLLNLKPWDEEERRRFDEKAVVDLLRRNPGAAGATYTFKSHNRGTVHRYPLCRLVRLGASFKTVRLCHRSHPAALTERTERRGTVLHEACKSRRVDAAVVRYLFRRDPAAAEITNKHAFTPLHCACSYGANAEVVRLLVGWYPAALTMTNKLGETPHMAAVNNGAAADVMEALSPGVIEQPRRSLFFKILPRRRSASAVTASTVDSSNSNSAIPSSSSE